MRVAALDLGSNSTRLLIAEPSRAHDGALTILERRSTVTRLAQDVERTGRLSDAAMDRVNDALIAYHGLMRANGVTRNLAVLTSATRDAANGPAFTRAVRERFGLNAHTLSGDEEARLTYSGATADRARTAAAQDDTAHRLVIDIGGGSTELVTGTGPAVDFHVSTQVGVVRHSERHLHTDPPAPHELQRLRDDARATFMQAVPERARAPVTSAIAVAGTPTSTAAILQRLAHDNHTHIHGYVIERAPAEELLHHLASLTEEQRSEVRGLHPARAPTIVAGLALLLAAMETFDLQRVEASEHDLLYGAAHELLRR